MKLHSDLIPPFGPPSFAVPVFTDGEQWFVQNIDIDGKVCGFAPFHRVAESLLRPATSSAEVKIGDPAIWAFAVNDEQVMHYVREDLQTLLKGMSHFFEERPFLAIDIHEFTGDEANRLKMVEKSALLMAELDGDAAARWLQMEAPSVFEQWIQQASAGDDSKKNFSEDGAGGGMMA